MSEQVPGSMVPVKSTGKLYDARVDLNAADAIAGAGAGADADAAADADSNADADAGTGAGASADAGAGADASVATLARAGVVCAAVGDDVVDVG
eukprot:10210386-Lingulodinium_polyedra.AAC.1